MLIGLGNEPLTPARVGRGGASATASWCCCAEDLGRLPGSLVRDVPSDAVQRRARPRQKVRTIAVQPPQVPSRGCSFDARHHAALASTGPG